jgi:hypothetical protein
MTTLDFKLSDRTQSAIFTEVGEFYSKSEADNAKSAFGFSIALLGASIYVLLAFWTSSNLLLSGFGVLVFSGSIIFFLKSMVRSYKAQIKNWNFRGKSIEGQFTYAEAARFMQQGMTFEEAKAEVKRIYN